MAVARTKLEKRVVELSATLKPLRQKYADRMEWEYQHYYDGKGLAYFLVLERCREFQVIRYYYKTSRSLFEFCQVFLNEKDKVVIAKDRWLGVDKWKQDSEMTIKRWFKFGHEYTYLGGLDRIGWSGAIIHSILPALKKRGMRKSTHGVNPYRFCETLLHNNRIETLLKLKQYHLVYYLVYNLYNFDEWRWQAIRVALRHGYHWDNKQEVSDWFDLLHFLNCLHLDTKNPHYICPKNLMEAHNHYQDMLSRRMERERKIEEEKRRIRRMEREKEIREEFIATRSLFNGMLITDGTICISVLPTQQDLIEEGKAMHHCVGNYTDRLNSLILSARINGKRIETIEVGLCSFDVVQSRGLQNKYTKYHERILKLMEDNMGEIKRRYGQRKVA